MDPGHSKPSNSPRASPHSYRRSLQVFPSSSHNNSNSNSTSTTTTTRESNSSNSGASTSSSNNTNNTSNSSSTSTSNDGASQQGGHSRSKSVEASLTKADLFAYWTSKFEQGGNYTKKQHSVVRFVNIHIRKELLDYLLLLFSDQNEFAKIIIYQVAIDFSYCYSPIPPIPPSLWISLPI